MATGHPKARVRWANELNLGHLRARVTAERCVSGTRANALQNLDLVPVMVRGKVPKRKRRSRNRERQGPETRPDHEDSRDSEQRPEGLRSVAIQPVRGSSPNSTRVYAKYCLICIFDRQWWDAMGN